MNNLVSLDSHILEVKVTKEMLAIAKEKAEQMGCLNRHSMMKGERNIEGVLGELAALTFLPNAVWQDTHDYDLTVGKITIDVKTKRLTRKPRLYYDCSIYGYNPNQNCHLYLFAGVDPEHTKVWLNGFIPKSDFYEKAEFFPAGSDRGNVVYKKDNYVVKVSQLLRVEMLKTIVPG